MDVCVCITFKLIIIHNLPTYHIIFLKNNDPVTVNISLCSSWSALLCYVLVLGCWVQPWQNSLFWLDQRRFSWKTFQRKQAGKISKHSACSAGKLFCVGLFKLIFALLPYEKPSETIILMKQPWKMSLLKIPLPLKFVTLLKQSPEMFILLEKPSKTFTLLFHCCLFCLYGIKTNWMLPLLNGTMMCWCHTVFHSKGRCNVMKW